MNLIEKKEKVIESYSKCLDKKLAYRKANLTDQEVELLNNDRDFQDRMLFFLIEKREQLVQQMYNHALSANEKISLSATLELGRMIYPEVFRGTAFTDTERPLTADDVEAFFNESAIKE